MLAFQDIQKSTESFFYFYLPPDGLLHLCHILELSAVDFTVCCISLFLRETVVLLKLAEIFIPSEVSITG